MSAPQLLNLADFTAQTQCAVDVDSPIFQPLPSVLEFKHYTPFEPTSLRLSFRNNDRFPRRIKIIPPDSPFFSVSGPTSMRGAPLVDTRVAPGTELCYTVTFTPRDVDDYAYELVCVTEREKFVVPLRATGKVAALSMPDAVSFPNVPVRSSTTRTMVLRNVGTKGAPYRIASPAPFIAAPDRGFVAPGEHVTVSLTFAPLEPAALDCELGVTYGDGDRHTVHVNLSGAGTELDVALGVAAVAMPATYVTLANDAPLRLSNRSEAPVEYRWRAFATEAEEAEERARRIAALEEQYALEVCCEWRGRGSVPPAWLAGPLLLLAAQESALGGSEFDEGGLQQLAPSAEAAGSVDDEDASLPLSPPPEGGRRSELNALRRKFRALRMAAETEPLPFESRVFTISPPSGVVSRGMGKCRWRGFDPLLASPCGAALGARRHGVRRRLRPG